MLLAIDPGHMSGWALLSEDGVVKDFGQVHYEDLFRFIERLPDDIKHVVVEEFRIRPGVNFSWSDMKTIRVIGMFELYAYQAKAHFELSQPANYKIGLKWSGLQLPKNHDLSHQFVAIAHAVYYSHRTLKNEIPIASLGSTRTDEVHT